MGPQRQNYPGQWVEAISSVLVRVGLGSSRLKDERTENCEPNEHFFSSSSPGRNEPQAAASFKLRAHRANALGWNAVHAP